MNFLTKNGNFVQLKEVAVEGCGEAEQESLGYPLEQKWFDKKKWWIRMNDQNFPGLV